MLRCLPLLHDASPLPPLPTLPAALYPSAQFPDPLFPPSPPCPQVPDNTVLVEFRKGFMLGGKLLRPAMVKVSVSEDAPASIDAEE